MKFSFEYILIQFTLIINSSAFAQTEEWQKPTITEIIEIDSVWAANGVRFDLETVPLSKNGGVI